MIQSRRQSKDEFTWHFKDKLFTTFRQNSEVHAEEDMTPAFFSPFVNTRKVERDLIWKQKLEEEIASLPCLKYLAKH